MAKEKKKLEQEFQSLNYESTRTLAPVRSNVGEEIVSELVNQGFKAQAQTEFQKVSIEVGKEGECPICLEKKDICFAIAPCGHGGICESCLKMLKSMKTFE